MSTEKDCLENRSDAVLNCFTYVFFFLSIFRKKIKGRWKLIPYEIRKLGVNCPKKIKIYPSWSPRWSKSLFPIILFFLWMKLEITAYQDKREKTYLSTFVIEWKLLQLSYKISGNTSFRLRELIIQSNETLFFPFSFPFLHVAL